ncbi:hypothetical protein CN918_28475 [Priestia megaterium]|nr:hypothetical protein CN918_28475 [Priestia megaterium]
MPESKIAKITAKNDANLFEGIAEGREWKVVTDPSISNSRVEVGNFLYCHVAYDNSTEEYYLAQETADLKASESEWQEQEKETE